MAEITAKGGCFVLGVGPTPDGIIEQGVVERLHAVGEWLRVNGQAIYATRTTPVYHDGNIWFTAGKDGETLYAIYALPEGEQLPACMEWKGNVPTGKMTLLKGNKRLKYTVEGEQVKVFLPEGLQNEPVVVQFRKTSI